MNTERLKRLPIILEHYGDRLSINLETGELFGRKTFPDKDGYLGLDLWIGNKGYKYKVHEIVAFLGGLNIENLQVNHLDGDNQNNRLENLEPATNQENRDHAKENKLHAFGEGNGMSVVTENDVRKIRLLFAEGFGTKFLSERFGIGTHAIRSIVLRKSWKHVE